MVNATLRYMSTFLKNSSLTSSSTLFQALFMLIIRSTKGFARQHCTTYFIISLVVLKYLFYLDLSGNSFHNSF